MRNWLSLLVDRAGLREDSIYSFLEDGSATILGMSMLGEKEIQLSAQCTIYRYHNVMG